MKSSIYISSEKIQVVGYSGQGKKVSVKRYEEAELHEGTMINGNITDADLLVESLSAMRNKNPDLFKDTTLIVDGSSILSKRIIIPKLTKKQSIQYIKDDFTDSSENSMELICDYRKSKNSEGAVFACAAETSLVDSYAGAFKNAGIKLKAIRVGLESILSYVDSSSALSQRSFILNLIDGFTMVSMIFEKGINVFMSRTRLYADDHEQFIQTLLEGLSGLIQFNRSQKFEDVTHSYYLGLNDLDLRFMQEINPYNDIEFDSLDIYAAAGRDVNLPPDAHFVFLNAQLNDSSIDFIRGRKTLNKLKRQQQAKNYWVISGVAIAVITCIPIVYLYFRISDTDKKIEAINSYLTDPVVVAKSEEIDVLVEETRYYNAVTGQIEYKNETDSAKGKINSAILDLITSTNSDTVTIYQISFDNAGKYIRISGGSAAEVDSAKYVDELKKSRFIDNVMYKGYSYNTDGEYRFSIDAALAGMEVSD